MAITQQVFTLGTFVQQILPPTHDAQYVTIQLPMQAGEPINARGAI